MDARDAVRMLDSLAEVHGEGVYPGRSNGSPLPSWESDPFHVLIATVLSQRTRDENTRRASDALFSVYDDAVSLSQADEEAIEGLIRPAGFPRQKAKAIKGICISLVNDHGGEVPADMEGLLALPMVGRKTANCVLSYGFGKDAICVDTHVHRISNLMGLVQTKDPDSTEEALRSIVPRERWSDVNRLMVRHGQTICLPRHEKCAYCTVLRFCQHGLTKTEAPDSK